MSFDNEATLQSFKCEVSTCARRAIETRYHKVREKYNKQSVALEYVEADENVADLTIKFFNKS